ncbi:MAG: hypothetical protein QXL17_05180 [Candidatus Thermoplasmatota archaeon]
MNVIPLEQINGCKDIVAVNHATRGEYNLLLKIRDPSRPGPQVLCSVPTGYTYTYHHPWNGKNMNFLVQQQYIGVTTKNDTIPNIVKPGMMISTAGIAYGDADTSSLWRNPTRYAWDDFDWLRYACEQADTEDEAVRLLTQEVVDSLHASSVAENLFVVGPTKAFVIEADAVHYSVTKIEDVLVRSNYPVNLWKNHRHNRLISKSFDTVKELNVRTGKTVHLGSWYGVQIQKIGKEFIIARQIPTVQITKRGFKWVGSPVKILINEQKTVGDYHVTLLQCTGLSARIRVEYVFFAWEKKITDIIKQKIGDITLLDMMNWSRLHSEDIDGLRPMCEDIYQYESSMIFKIPKKEYDWLSSGWFAPNHPCCSIYVPVHVEDVSIHPAYTSGEAATIALQVLETYGHSRIIPWIQKIEDVFLEATDYFEEIAQTRFTNQSLRRYFLTLVDTMMQDQAYRTMKLWTQYPCIGESIGSLWMNDYLQSLIQMKHQVLLLNTTPGLCQLKKDISMIAVSLCRSHINLVRILRNNISSAEEYLQMGTKCLENDQFLEGFEHLETALNMCYICFESGDPIAINKDYFKYHDNNMSNSLHLVLVITSICLLLFFIIMKKRHNA